MRASGVRASPAATSRSPAACRRTQFGFVGPTGYNFALSVQMLFGLVIGGMHSLAGAIIGGLFLDSSPASSAGLGKGLSALLYAVLLIAAIVAMPNGIAGALTRLAAAARRLSSP